MRFEVKARKMGNSAVLILPREARSRMTVQGVDSVFPTTTENGGFRISPHNPELGEQMKVADSLIRRYRNTLRELAK